MSNSSRIEAATRGHVGAVLTSEQIAELVKLSDPTSTKGVYPSDCAGKRLPDGTLTFRGKASYGDLILELVAPNSYKVLASEQIVRRPGSGKTQAAASAPVAAPVPVAATPVKKGKKGKKSSSSVPVPPKAAKADKHATQ